MQEFIFKSKMFLQFLVLCVCSYIADGYSPSYSEYQTNFFCLSCSLTVCVCVFLCFYQPFISLSFLMSVSLYYESLSPF